MISKALVRELRRVAPDVMHVELKLSIARPLKFTAGQYIDLLLPNGERRSYSLANLASVEGDIDLDLHIRHLPGGVFTDPLFSTLKTRTLLDYEGPLGSLFLREDSNRPIVLVASGTGYAPIRSIIETALARGIDRPMQLYWGCRSKQDLYALDEPMKWSTKHRNFSFVPVLSEPSPEDKWEGRVGFVHRAVMQDHPDLSAHVVFACGVPVMVDAARSEFSGTCGLPPDQFFADAFITQADVAAAQ
jgi:CDP-4-dehydro-6-deoxyglucose reductase